MIDVKNALARIKRQASVLTDDLETLETILASNEKVSTEKGKSEFYTINDFANLVDSHPNTIRRWIKLGVLKPDKIGRKYVFWKSDLNKYLEALSKKQLQ